MLSTAGVDVVTHIPARYIGDVLHLSRGDDTSGVNNIVGININNLVRQHKKHQAPTAHGPGYIRLHFSQATESPNVIFFVV